MSNRHDLITDKIMKAESQLTSRDRTLLGWLYDHGQLTTPQITAALFGSRRACHQRLHHLMGLRLITRWRPLREGGGTYPYHYVLDRLGAQLVAVQRGQPIPRPGQLRAHWLRLICRPDRAHLLGVNQFFTDLAAYARRHRQAELRHWSAAFRVTERGTFTEADDYAGIPGLRPKPDGYGVWAEHDNPVAFLFTYDRGSGPLTTLLDKIRQHGLIGKQPLPVLAVLPGRECEYYVHAGLARHRIADAVVATANEEDLAEYQLNPAEAVWWRHGEHSRRLRLSQLHPSSPLATGCAVAQRSAAQRARCSTQQGR